MTHNRPKYSDIILDKELNLRKGLMTEILHIKSNKFTFSF